LVTTTAGALDEPSDQEGEEATMGEEETDEERAMLVADVDGVAVTLAGEEA
jgi:hypothetical protein